MPHGETWLTFLARWLGIDDNVRGVVEVINSAITGEPTTFLAHEEPGIAHLLGSILVFLVIGGGAYAAFAEVKETQKAIVPDDKLTVRTMFELVVQAVYAMMSDIMGAKAARVFLPLIGTCAFFIFVSNALGLIPGFEPPTNNLNTTLALAGIIFVATHVFGLYYNGLNHVKHLLGPIVKWYALPLMILMFFIEVISHVARPISLSIRLMANMVADHLVVGAFLSIIAFVLPLPVMLLGTLVVVVQTLVFCVLSTVYIGLAIEHGEDHH
jgi:F-type H+-transporting ATPase subunit a